MAISGFGRGKGGESMSSSGAAAPPAPKTSSSSSSGMGGLTAFIDQGSEFEGKLSFNDTVRIDGCFRGEISSENTLIVGESGEIQATIRSKIVVISGNVVGDIHAGEQIVMHKTAHVEGEIKSPSVVIEEGAVFNGSLDMKKGGASQGASSASSSPNGNLKAIKGGSDASDSSGAPKK